MTAIPARPVVLSAPTGAGKTTIARRLVEREPNFVFSVSATTRAPRAGEVAGVDYHFVDDAEFERMIRDDELAEWARVHGRWYGTPLRNLREATARGQFTLLDIDVQGAAQIRDRMPEAVRIFVLPPSLEVWIERLRGRGTEDDAELRRRLASALDELRRVGEFDHVVVNTELEGSVDRIRALARGEVNDGDPLGVQARVATLIAGVETLMASPEPNEP
jgi:guanylate kinase